MCGLCLPRQVAVKRAFEYEPNEFWVVQTGRPLSAGNYTLSLAFAGNLTRSITGLYRSVYTNGDTGQKRSVIGPLASTLDPRPAR